MQQEAIVQFVIYFILLLIAGFAITFILKYSYGLFSARFLHDFRYYTVGGIQKIPFSAMEKHHSGDLLSRMTNDITIVQDFIGNNFLDIFKQLIMLMAAGSYMIFLNWKLFAFSTFIIPLSLIVVHILMRPMKEYYKKSNAALGKANSIAQDSLTGIFTVKAFNLQPVITGKYHSFIAEGADYNIKGAGIMRWMPPFNILLRAMPTVFCIGYGSFLIVAGEMTPGDLIAFNFLLGFVQWPLAFLPDILNRLKRTIGAAERVAEIMNIPVERTSGSDFSNNKSSAVIRFGDVTFAYHEGQNVINSLSFDMKQGEKIAIVGPSGCGKSTVLKLLCGNYETHRGAIQVMGCDTREWSLDTLRSLFAVITQEIFLFPVSVYENIAYGRPGATRNEIISAAQTANAHEFIMELPDGYDSLVGERGIKLSGGQKQRIALARAALKKAPILLLDEPTSALDTHSESLVQEAIEKSLENRTAIIIAHRLSSIKKADRILVMDKGSLIEQGKHEELFMQNGLYTKLYLKQLNSQENTETDGNGQKIWEADVEN